MRREDTDTLMEKAKLQAEQTDVGAFNSTLASHCATRPHMTSTPVLNDTRHHSMLGYSIRDPPPALVHHGVLEQSVGFVTCMVRDNGHARDVQPINRAVFDQGEEAAK